MEAGDCCAVFDALMAHARAPIALFAPDGRVLACNQPLLETWRLPAEAVIGSVGPGIFADAPECDPAVLARAAAGEVVELAPHRHVVQGVEVWCEGTVAPVALQAGTALLAISREVTDRVRAEELAAALRAEQEVTASLAAAATSEADVARVAFRNAQRLAGASALALALRAEGDAFQVTHVHGADAARALLGFAFRLTDPGVAAEAVRTREPVFLEDPATLAARYPGYECRVMEAGFPAEVALPLPHDGQVVGVAILGYEAPRAFSARERSILRTLASRTALALTRARLLERERAAAARLMRFEELTTALASALSPRAVADAVFAHGLSALRADVSTVTFAEGGETTEIIYRRAGAPTELHPPAPPTGAREPIWLEDGRAAAAAFPGAAAGLETLALIPLTSSERRAVGWMSLAWTGARRLSDEERTYALVVAGHLAQALERARLFGAERAAREEAERTGALQERLMAIIGHDLRSPIASIAASARLVLRRGVPSDQAPTVARIARAADRAWEIIRDLVDFGRARRGASLSVERRPVRVAEICERVLAEVREAEPTVDLRLTSRDDGGEAELDPVRVGQVVSNLVGNAVQHGGGAPVEVAVSGTPDEVVLEVRNTGPTIPADELPYLFEPFRRGGQATARAGSVGLGLFIVRQIVTAHGGTVAARSDDQETVFTVRLPRAPAAPAFAGP